MNEVADGFPVVEPKNSWDKTSNDTCILGKIYIKIILIFGYLDFIL